MEDEFDIAVPISKINANLRAALVNSYHRGNAVPSDPKLKDYHSEEMVATKAIERLLAEIAEQFRRMQHPKAKEKGNAPKGHRDWTPLTVRPDATRSLEVLLEDKTNGYRFVVPGVYSVGLNALNTSRHYPDSLYTAIAYRNPPSQELLKLVGEQE